MLEAMASGLALIVTDTGGTKELVHGNGLVVRKESSEQLADAISRLVKNKSKIIAMGRKSRRIAERMSWSNVAEKYLEVYGELA